MVNLLYLMNKGKFNKNMYIKKYIYIYKIRDTFYAVLEKIKGVTNDVINIFKMYERYLVKVYFIIKSNERIILIVQD